MQNCWYYKSLEKNAEDEDSRPKSNNNQTVSLTMKSKYHRLALQSTSRTTNKNNAETLVFSYQANMHKNDRDAILILGIWQREYANTNLIYKWMSKYRLENSSANFAC